MVFLLLGPLEVRDGSAPLPLGGRKPRALLARLLLDANRTVPVERLVDDLWGEDVPETAAKMVQIHVSQLRKVLPRDVLRTRPGGYELAADTDAIDVERVARLGADGRRALAAADAERAAALLREALALWRGDALAEFGEPFAVTEAARLDELRLACLEDRIDADLALGRHADVAAELEALVARAGLRERLRGQLMLALYRCGRHADALAAYHDFRRTLDEELGLVPSAALADLERRILVQDPALAAPPRPAEQPPPSPAGRPEPVAPAEPSPPGPAAAPPAAEPAAAAATQPAPPPAPASASGVRELRRVTVLSCSLPGATELAERLDPEDLHELVRDFRRSCSEIVERFGGHVAWTAGHGHLAYFGLRCAREDDPRRAVRAGLAAAAAVSTAGGERVAIRCGVDTGLVVAGGPDGEEPLTGGAVADAAARLAAAAPPAGVLIGPATERLLRGAFELRARDGAFEVLREAIAPRSVADAHGRPPLIGRTHELGLLAERHRRAAAGHGQVVVVSGEPGIGKSRLVAELHRRAAAPGPGSRPIVVRCSPDHTGSALYPVATALAGPGHDGPEHEGDVELRGLLAPLLGTGGPAALDATAAEHKQRLLGVLSDRLLHAAAGDGARLVVFEDAHWADPSTLELLERLVREVATTSVLLVVTVRPGLAPSWTARSYVAQLTLDRFGDAEVAALVSALLGGTVPPTGLVAAIEERTDGVPLFVEEVVRAMLESGVLERRDDGAYDLAGPATALAIPETLHDLLVARLDRLGPAKAVAQVAAVLGRRFDRELLHAVEPVDGAALDDALARLVEAELLHQRGRGAQARYVFRHALVREAAYESLLRSTRRSYHARVAQVLGERFPALAEAQPEVLAHHHAAAGQHGDAAVAWLRAGDRALRASAYAEATGHAEAGLRALGALPADDSRTALELDLQLTLGSARMGAVGYGARETEAAFARAEQLSGALEDSTRLAPALYGLAVYSCARGEQPRARDLARRLRRIADAAGDADVALEADVLLAVEHFLLGELDAGDAFATRALAAWDPERHRAHMHLFGQEPGVVAHSAHALLLAWSGRIDEARRVSAAGVRVARELRHPLTLAYMLGGAGVVELVARDADAVAAIADELLAVTTEHELPTWVVWGRVFRGWARARRGDPDGGLAEAEEALLAGAAAGFLAMRSYFLAVAADAALDAGRPAYARRLVAEGRALVATTGERVAQADLERVAGRIALADERPDEAEAALEAAVPGARAQGAPPAALHAAPALAEACAAAGRGDPARARVARAIAALPDGSAASRPAAARALVHRLGSRRCGTTASTKSAASSVPSAP